MCAENHILGLLPDTQNCGFGMRRECRERVPWCMQGSLTSDFLWSRWRGRHSRHSRRMHNPQIYVSGKRSIRYIILTAMTANTNTKSYQLVIATVILKYGPLCTLLHTMFYYSSKMLWMNMRKSNLGGQLFQLFNILKLRSMSNFHVTDTLGIKVLKI